MTVSSHAANDSSRNWIRLWIMVIVPLVLVSVSSKSKADEDKSPAVKRLKDALLKVVRRKPSEHRHSAACESDCEKRADESLHELATRLHVLEWEAYGPDAAKRKKRT